MLSYKTFFSVFCIIMSFGLKSQWGIAYNQGWGNRDLNSYPNYFSSVDYVGDGINGHRLDIYFPALA